MANFLVNSPNLLTEGTDSNDLIILTTGAALGATVYGNGGDDQIDVATALAANSIINGNEGADSVNITGGAFTLAKVAGGADNDSLQLHGLAATTLTTVHGGKGADTIIFSGGAGFTNGVINGNGGHDLITTDGTFSASTTRLSLGKGNDTLALTAGLDFGGSIIGGAGNDRIAGTLSALGTVRVEGDSLADPDAVGNDTITLTGTFVGTGNLVQGGAGADVITISAGGLNDSTVNGNAGHDSITIGAGSITSGYLGGGAGNDTITVEGAFAGAFGTLAGGDGTDVISVNANSAAAARGTVIGGAGSDTISFGTVTAGTTIQSRYTTFSDSNIAAFDVIAASGNGNFVIGQTVVTATLAAAGSVGGNSGYTVTAGGVVTSFGSNVGGGVTARAQVLDQFLVAGQTVTFSDSTGAEYVFIQGGAAGSGTEGDFIASVNTTAGISGLAVAGGTAITVSF